MNSHGLLRHESLRRFLLGHPFFSDFAAKEAQLTTRGSGTNDGNYDCGGQIACAVPATCCSLLGEGRAQVQIPSRICTPAGTSHPRRTQPLVIGLADDAGIGIDVPIQS
jgi:hypothetical protein